MIVVRLFPGFLFFVMAGCVLFVLRQALKPWPTEAKSKYGEMDAATMRRLTSK